MHANCEQIVRRMSLMFAMSEAVFDQQGTIVDYRLLRVNPAFEAYFDIDEEGAVGSLMSQWLFQSQRIPEEWLERFSDLQTTTGGKFEERFENSIDEKGDLKA